MWTSVMMEHCYTPVMKPPSTSMRQSQRGECFANSARSRRCSSRPAKSFDYAIPITTMPYWWGQRRSTKFYTGRFTRTPSWRSLKGTTIC